MTVRGLVLVILLAMVSTLERANLQIIDCDQEFRSREGSKTKSGTFMSPYYPNNYQPQMQCLYKFIALPSERVKVDFDDFVLQGNPAERCHEDYVDIYAELQQPEIRLEDAETTISGRYCGRIAPRTRISLYNIIIVGFYSNDNVQERGFNASYHFMKDERYHVGEKAPGTICDQTITAAAYSEGQILSPTYPGAYPNNLHCTYSLEGNPLQRIQLIFDDFDLYYGGPHCPYDWLKVHDGRSTDAPLINTMLCGYKHRGKVIFSTKENLFLEFHSSKAPDSENLGFNIHFKFSSEFVSLNFLGLPEYHVRGTECDQRIPSRGISNGTIISPNYPRKYMPGRVCKYLVDGLNDDQNLEKVNLVFREFNIPRDAYGKCNDGYVAFYLNGDDTEGMPNHQWCGNYTFHPVISKGPRLLMVLHSGNSSGWGFKAQYSFLTDYGIPGTLCSQNDVTEGSPQQCCFTYSGKSQELTGAFVSPRHPHKYPSITDCIYNFVASPNQLIRIRFVKFDLASEDPPPGVYPHGTEYCQDDWVEIYQIWSDSPKDREMRVGRYCKSLTPGPWISEPGVSRLKVLFHSNKDHQAQGFSAVYTFVKGKAKVADSKTSAQALTYERETTCGGILDKGGGTFQTPQYGRTKYTVKTHCSWEIRANPGNKLLVFFSHKLWKAVEGLMSSEVGCQGAAVRVFTNSSDLFTPTAEFCGEDLAEFFRNFTSTGNLMRVTFTSSDKATGSQGFRATWTELINDQQCTTGFKCKRNGYCISKELVCRGKDVQYCGNGDSSDLETCFLQADNNIFVIIGSVTAGLLMLIVLTALICYRRQRKRAKIARAEVKAKVMMTNNAQTHAKTSHNDLTMVHYRPAPQVDTVVSTSSHQTVV